MDIYYLVKITTYPTGEIDFCRVRSFSDKDIAKSYLKKYKDKSDDELADPKTAKVPAEIVFGIIAESYEMLP